MSVAMYARVSTERQEREQTIAGQLVLLRAWAEAQVHAVAEEHRYIDEGYSGSRYGTVRYRHTIRMPITGSLSFSRTL